MAEKSRFPPVHAAVAGEHRGWFPCLVRDGTLTTPRWDEQLSRSSLLPWSSEGSWSSEVSWSCEGSWSRWPWWLYKLAQLAFPALSAPFCSSSLLRSTSRSQFSEQHAKRTRAYLTVEARTCCFSREPLEQRRARAGACTAKPMPPRQLHHR